MAVPANASPATGEPGGSRAAGPSLNGHELGGRSQRTPLSNPVVTAMLVQGHPSAEVEKAEGPEVRPSGQPDQRAADLVTEATGPETNSPAGEQVTFLRQQPSGPFQTVTARTTSERGGTQVTFEDRSTSTFVPDPSATTAEAFPSGTVWSQTEGARIHERKTIQLTAQMGDADGVVVARYWIDEQTHAVLWQQTYHANGQVLGSAGFTKIDDPGKPVRDDSAKSADTEQGQGR